MSLLRRLKSPGEEEGTMYEAELLEAGTFDAYAALFALAPQRLPAAPLLHLPLHISQSLGVGVSLRQG